MDLYLTGFVGLRLYFVAFQDALDVLCVGFDVFVHVNEGKVGEKVELAEQAVQHFGDCLGSTADNCPATAPNSLAPAFEVI